MVGGRFVFGAGEFAGLDDVKPPPAMPDWSPVRRFGGYAAWADEEAAGKPDLAMKATQSCGCAAAMASFQSRSFDPS